MRRAATGCDGMFSQSNIITLSRAVGARRALSRHVAVSRGGRQMESPAPGSGAGRNHCSTFAGDDRGSACSVKSAALGHEREMGISRGREPRERNAGTSLIERRRKLRRILPNGRRSWRKSSRGGSSESGQASDIAGYFVRHGGCLAPCLQKHRAKQISAPIGIPFSLMPRPLRWGFREGRGDAFFDRLARHHVRRSREGDDLLEAQAGERGREGLDQARLASARRRA